MPGTLYLVATPIGNLEDVTLRALRILRDVQLIAAEDTRRTAKLLNHYEIRTPSTSFHQHNEREKTPHLLRRLAAGDAIALVTDAGMPGVSDPGQHLVDAAQNAGLRVEVIPGASAVLAALALSGLPTENFTFFGFPPHRSKDRLLWFERAAAERGTFVFFEAPHRIRLTLEDARDVWAGRIVAACREITKAHEELVKGPISEVLGKLGDPRGEFTIVVGPASGPETPTGERATPAVVVQQFGLMTNFEGLTRRQAIAALSRRYRLPAKEIYQTIETAKKLVE